VRKYGNESITKMEKRKNNPNYKSEDDEDQQDGGITVEESSSGGSIDWGAISSSEISPNSVNSGVQWDTVPSQPALQWDIGSGSGSSGINWDITIENEGESDPVIQLISDNQEKKSDTILEDSSTRKQFVFSLIELDAFFSQRLQDFSSQSDIHINLNQMPGAPMIIHKHDNPENLKKYSDAITTVLSFMESEHLQNLLEMKNSKSVVERLAQSIQIKLDRKIIAERNASDCQCRSEEINAEIKLTYPKLEVVKQYSQQLKSKIENELSKQYSGRVVRIFGEIDKM